MGGHELPIGLVCLLVDRVGILNLGLYSDFIF